MTPSPDVTDEEDLYEDGLSAKLAEGAHGVIVHFEDSAAMPANVASIQALDVQYRFDNIPAIYAVGTQAAVETVASRGGVSFIEDAWKPIEYHLNSATISSRAREVFDPDFVPPDFSGIDEPSPEQLDEDGTPIDGEGVGIAVVDSGIDAGHPGLDEGKVVRNFLATPAGVVEAGNYTETGDGHGTRLAGIAAGTGEGWDGPTDLRGAAPGASLYGFATSPQEVTIRPAIAFDWILSNGDEQTPPIEIVLNGWSCKDLRCGDPSEAHLDLASQLAEAGMLVVFPVGNNGGIGFRPLTSAEATLPTPGVLGVANHDDEDAGSRSDCIHSDSSRGDAFDPATWPDVAAPGDDVRSPDTEPVSALTGVPLRGGNDYTVADGGTSLAAAHAAGVAALVEQAHGGDLTGEQLEYILEVTAHQPTPRAKGDCPIPFVQADPANPWDASNFAAGHGLVDAMDAVELSETFTGLPDTEPSLDPIPENLTAAGPAVSPQGEPLYLDGQDGFSDEAPTDQQPRTRVLQAGEPLSHTTEPFQSSQTFSGVHVELWAGSANEFGALRCANTFLTATASLVDSDTGTTSKLGSVTIPDRFVAPGAPWLRDLPIAFDEAVTFSPGDRLEVTFSVNADTGDCVGAPGQTSRTIYSGAEDTPSRIRFAETTREIESDTFEACQVLELSGEFAEQVGCGWVGGERESAPLNCQIPPIFPVSARDLPSGWRVEWFGPPGSGIVLSCPGASTACVVPGQPGGPWAKCEATSPTTVAAGQSSCNYFTASGEEVDGWGFCRIGG